MGGGFDNGSAFVRTGPPQDMTWVFKLGFRGGGVGGGG